MKIGLIVPMGDELQDGVPSRWPGIRDLATSAESSGLDSVWVYDHLIFGGPERAADSPWEAWTLLTAIAAVTSRVRLGALVLCAAWRHPGLLARMADSLQELSGDRLVLGLGAGWHKPEFDAFGFEFTERVERFAESLEIIADMMRTGRSSFSGRHYVLADAPIRDRPDRVPPEILVAARRPRMLGLTARRADAWNTAWYGHPGRAYRQLAAELDAACEAAGRDPGSVRRTVGFRIADHSSAPANTDPAKLVHGGPDEVAEAIAAWAGEGVDELICWPEPNNPAGLDLLVRGVQRYRG
jgi:alkanesulfonate monooxygenase SsuD/methylene tetrahydromethanopterin reductase-like flavin-dependent oxidoreductase (luciferase family)